MLMFVSMNCRQTKGASINLIQMKTNMITLQELNFFQGGLKCAYTTITQLRTFIPDRFPSYGYWNDCSLFYSFPLLFRSIRSKIPDNMVAKTQNTKYKHYPTFSI